MILYPAIDLKDSRCVRLFRGDMDQVTVYNENPAAQARQFQDDGFQYIHLVDLNGAIEGRAINADCVDEILSNVTLPVQLGGGIRDMATIDYWLNKGIARVILGTIALRDPELVKTACRTYPGKIAVGIDAREGLVAVAGWVETSNVKALDLALRFEDCGVCAIVYTDITRDGAMSGINIEETADLAYALTTPVIASGGLSGIADLIALKQEADNGAGINGVISGKALYDGRIDPKEALRLLAGETV